MTPARLRTFAILFAVLMVLGALIVRMQLLSDLREQLPLLSAARPSPTALNATGTPGTQVRIATPKPGASPSVTAIPSATPSPAASEPGRTPTPDEPYRVYLPEVQAPGAPAPPQTMLTPEARPAPSTPSATPAPTATRGPLKVTKLGVGLYDSGGAHLPLLDQMRPSVILLMDPTVDFAKDVRRMFPKAFIVGRIFAVDQPLDNPEAQGVAFADRVAQTAVPLKGIVDTWMGYNEITGHKDYNNYRAYNRFQVAFAKRLQDHYGIDAMAGNDGTGTVDPEDYAKYFAESISISRYFGIHSYAPKGETTMRNPRSHYLVLRHREIRAALVKAGVKHGPFVITESGLWDGWRGYTSEGSMAEDYIWFADELAKDDYVIGTTIFGLFSGDRWEPFNVAGTSIVDRIGAYNTLTGG